MDWRDVWEENQGSWFDLVACCYYVICAGGNERPGFSARVESAVSMPGSPVDEFVRSVRGIVPANGLGRRCTKEQIAELYCLCNRYKSDPAWPSEYTDEIGCWAIIAGIDKCVADSGSAKLVGKMGPLNKVLCERVGAYYKHSPAPIDDILSSYGICSSPMETLSERLQGLSVVARIPPHRLPVIWKPSGAVVRIGDNAHGRQSDGSTTPSLKLRLGIIACSHNISIGSNSPDISIVQDGAAGLFGVEYAPAYGERYEELIGAPLDRAIAEGCNCVVFPEMVFSPEYLERLKSQLKTANDAGVLRLVVAGTAWCPSGRPDEGSNTCYVLDRYGNELSATSKKHPYINDHVEPHQIEGLDPSIDETTLLDIEGLGRLMIAICKDMESDTDYSYMMASAFRPDMLCVPAASGSVKGAFLDRAKLISKRLHAICCISNLCSMVQFRSNEDDISFVTAPEVLVSEFRGRQPDAKVAFCARSALCGTSKGKCVSEGCLFVVDIDYDKQIGGRIPLMAVGDLSYIRR